MSKESTGGGHGLTRRKLMIGIGGGTVGTLVLVSGIVWLRRGGKKRGYELGLDTIVEYAQDVRCPVLHQIADHDSIIPKNTADETIKQLGDYANVKHYPIGHFDIYIGENFERSVSDQLDFFKQHL